jgi:iron complex outermembrane receptor protein
MPPQLNKSSLASVASIHYRQRTRRLRLALLPAALLAIPALSQQTANPPVEKLAPVVVTGTRVEQSSFNTPASIDVLDSSDLQDGRARVNLSESFARIPGVIVQNRQNYAQDLQVSTRGFGARSTFGIRGLRLIVDDIPATNPDGQGQAATINLGSTKRIEVLRGPFSALYGNSSGGVIQAFTEDGPLQPTFSTALLSGSYGTWRAEAKMGGQNEGGLNYLGDLSRFHTDGYREHSSATRDQDNLKLSVHPGENSKLTLVGNYLHQPETQDPLGLTRAQADADPRQVDPSAVTFNTRKSIENGQAGVVYEHQLGAADSLRFVGYSGIRRVRQFLAVPRGAQIPATSSGGVVDLDRDFAGGGLRWTHKIEGDRPLTLNAGMEYEWSKEQRKGYENFLGSTFGVLGALRRDEDDTVSSFDQYVQAEWQFAKQWALLAGVRNSEVKFDSQDHFIRTGNPDDSGQIKFHHVNPVVGALFKATPTLNVYANYGRGFETPTFAELAYKPDGTSGLNFGLKPSTSNNIEAGVKTFLNADTRLNLAVFEIHTDDEIVPATNSGGRTTFQNASKTRRRGIELSLDATLPADLSAYFAYTYLNAEFTEAFTYRPTAAPTTVTVPEGSAIPGVPRAAAYAELAWRRGLAGFSAALEINYRDKIFVNDVNSEAADSYTTANARVGYRHKTWGWDFTEFVRVDNLTDKKYIGSVIVNESNGRFYEPAPERAVMVGINASYAF